MVHGSVTPPDFTLMGGGNFFLPGSVLPLTVYNLVCVSKLASSSLYYSHSLQCFSSLMHTSRLGVSARRAHWETHALTAHTQDSSYIVTYEVGGSKFNMILLQCYPNQKNCTSIYYSRRVKASSIMCISLLAPCDDRGSLWVCTCMLVGVRDWSLWRLLVQSSF